MNNKFLRQKTSISSPTLPRTSDVFSLRPLSSYQFKNRSSNTFELEKQNQERRSYSTSSLWRIINTAKCSEPLNEEILQPIRKNLQQKMDRLKTKRKEQEQKYQRTLALIKKKCGKQIQIERQKFIEARKLLKKWDDDRSLQKLRYTKRMLKIK